jgi:hypothetical protein
MRELQEEKKNCSREVPCNHCKRLRAEYVYIHAANPTHARKEVIVLSPLLDYLVDVSPIFSQPPELIASRFILCLSSNCISISKSVKCVY